MSLRILMIAPTPFFGDRGCHTQIYEQIRSLTRLGNQVRLCTYPAGRDLPGLDIRRAWRPPWGAEEKVGPSRNKYFLDLSLLALSLRETWRFRPDIIHGHLHEGALLGGLVRNLTGVPVLFDLQGSLTGEMLTHRYLREGSWKHRLFEEIERFTDLWADAVVTQAVPMRDELVNKFGVPADRVSLTMDGVDSNDFRPGLDASDLRKQYALPEEAPVVVYIGLLTTYQGVDCLMEAIPHVLRRVPRVIFLVMGYPDEDRYAALARRLGVPDANIRFTGRIPYEKAPHHIGLGSVAVSPKLGVTEANGKLYNYMACGVATVAFDNAVNREILGDTGVYARLGDAQSLAEQVISLLESPEHAARLGAAARARVVERFSWDAVARRLMVCYRKVLS
jgi:glycosyltransferase involved in cell wall biosynthesis